MNQDTKTRLLGMFLAVLDGRDPRQHVMMLDGLETIEGFRVIRVCDELLRRQWTVMGSPTETIIDEACECAPEQRGGQPCPPCQRQATAAADPAVTAVFSAVQ